MDLACLRAMHEAAHQAVNLCQLPKPALAPSHHQATNSPTVRPITTSSPSPGLEKACPQPETCSTEHVLHQYGLAVVERDQHTDEPVWLACKFCPTFGCKAKKTTYIMAYVAPFVISEMREHVTTEHPDHWQAYQRMTPLQQAHYFEHSPSSLRPMRTRVDTLKDASHLHTKDDIAERSVMMQNGGTHKRYVSIKTRLKRKTHRIERKAWLQQVRANIVSFRNTDLAPSDSETVSHTPLSSLPTSLNGATNSSPTSPQPALEQQETQGKSAPPSTPQPSSSTTARSDTCHPKRDIKKSEGTPSPRAKRPRTAGTAISHGRDNKARSGDAANGSTLASLARLSELSCLSHQFSSTEKLAEDFGLHVVERDQDTNEPVWMVCQFCPTFGCKTKKRTYVMAYVTPFATESILEHAMIQHSDHWQAYTELASSEMRTAYFNGNPALIETMRKRVDTLKKSWELHTKEDLAERLRFIEKGGKHGAFVALKKDEKKKKKKKKATTKIGEEVRAAVIVPPDVEQLALPCGSRALSAEELADHFGLTIVEREDQAVWLACTFCAEFGCHNKKQTYISVYVTPFSAELMRLHATSQHPHHWRTYNALNSLQKRREYFTRTPLREESMRGMVDRMKISWRLDTKEMMKERLCIIENGGTNKTYIAQKKRQENTEKEAMTVDIGAEVAGMETPKRPARKAKTIAEEKIRAKLERAALAKKNAHTKSST